MGLSSGDPATWETPLLRAQGCCKEPHSREASLGAPSMPITPACSQAPADHVQGTAGSGECPRGGPAGGQGGPSRGRQLPVQAETSTLAKAARGRWPAPGRPDNRPCPSCKKPCVPFSGLNTQSRGSWGQRCLHGPVRAGMWGPWAVTAPCPEKNTRGQHSGLRLAVSLRCETS